MSKNNSRIWKGDQKCSKLKHDRKIISLNVDYSDEVLGCEDFGYRNYDEDKIRLLMERSANSGFNRIFWRISTCGKVDYLSEVEDIYDYSKYNKKTVCKDFVPLKVAGTYARDFGLEIYAWMTLYDDNPVVMSGSEEMTSVLCKTHPEWQVVSKDGKESYPGVFCYAYPGVRKHKLAILKELAQYDIDGIMLSTRSHSRPYGWVADGKKQIEEYERMAAKVRDRFDFNAPIVDEYKKRYNVDIRKDDFDKDLLNKLRGEYLTLFLQEARELLTKYNKKICMMVKDENKGESIGGHRLGWLLGNLYTDWEKWVDDSLVDELCIYDEERLSWWDFRKENWWEGALDFVERYKNVVNNKVRLLLWFDIWTWEWRTNPDYMKRYGHPGKPWHSETKPPEVLTKMIQAALESKADGFTLHEALNIEWFSMWKSIKEAVRFFACNPSSAKLLI